MHCVLLSSPQGKQAWSVQRSVEILAYHRSEQRVSIQLMLLARCRMAGEPLRLLHRGKVQAFWQTRWPLPPHPDEDDRRNGGTLHTLYGRAFKEHGVSFCWTKKLTAWDSWFDVPYDEQEEILVWKPASPTDSTVQCELETEAKESGSVGDSWMPFTTWLLESPCRVGLCLIVLHLQFSGETYERLLPAGSYFSVDGPRRLVPRIESQDLTDMKPDDRNYWLDRLTAFSRPSCVVPTEAYDVVVMGPPYADRVELEPSFSTSSVIDAPLQPKSSGRRFLTTDDLFTITFRYAGDSLSLVSNDLSSATRKDSK